MNSISEKNQKFILEGLNLLTSIDDLKECEKTIFEFLKAFSDGSIIDKTELFKVLDMAEYFKVKTNDIVGTVSLHISKVQYEQEDVQDKLSAVSKNAHIGNVTLPGYIVTKDFLPTFDLTLTNLGLDGIDKDKDEIYLKLHYPDLTEFSEKVVPVTETVNDLMGSLVITVENMKSPGRNYEYILSIHLRNKETQEVFGKLEIGGINISKEEDLIHVVSKTYTRL